MVQIIQLFSMKTSHIYPAFTSIQNKSFPSSNIELTIPPKYRLPIPYLNRYNEKRNQEKIYEQNNDTQLQSSFQIYYVQFI